MIQKTVCRFICFFMISCLACFSVSAEQNPAHGTITVDTVVAKTGDTVIIPIRITNNPGIMAITVSVTYDSEALIFEKYIRGYLKDYTIMDHPEKGLIRFLNCESRNRNDNGIMVSFQFKVKDNASIGLHPITIDYQLGDFANWNLEKLSPAIIPGGINLIPDCRLQGHQFLNGFCVKCGVDEKIAPFDLNGDTELNALDLFVLQTGLLTNDPQAAFDLNCDGEINILDLIRLKNILAN